MNDRIIYYVSKIKPNPDYVNLSNGELYDKVYKSSIKFQIKWHEEYGKDGFSSERTDPACFNIKAHNEAKAEVNNRAMNVLYEINSIVVNDEIINEAKKIVENSKDFIKWIGEKDDNK